MPRYIIKKKKYHASLCGLLVLLSVQIFFGYKLLVNMVFNTCDDEPKFLIPEKQVEQ